MLNMQVNGVELSYQIHGSGDKDLVFVHGYGARSTGELYAPLYSCLAPHFRIFALDMRGHGGASRITDDFTLDQVAADIIGFCEVLHLCKPLYAGHSLGGTLGLLCELKKPGIFDGLVLLNPAAATGAADASAEVIESALKDHRNKEVMRRNYRQMYVNKVSDGDVSLLVDVVCLVDPAVNEHYLRVEFPKLNISDRLSSIAPPVLFLNGSKDIVIPLQAQHETALRLPNYKEVIFSDEGHMLPVESPKRTSVEMINFLKNDLRSL